MSSRKASGLAWKSICSRKHEVRVPYLRDRVEANAVEGKVDNDEGGDKAYVTAEANALWRLWLAM